MPLSIMANEAALHGSEYNADVNNEDVEKHTAVPPSSDSPSPEATSTGIFIVRSLRDRPKSLVNCNPTLFMRMFIFFTTVFSISESEWKLMPFFITYRGSR